MALPSEWKSNHQNNTILPDWRVVGNRNCHSMRTYGSLSRKNSYSTEVGDSAWKLFKGFQWKDTDEKESNHFDLSFNEPFSRQNRSFSFSTGQGPLSFGYDDYPLRTQFSESILEEEEQARHFPLISSKPYAPLKVNTSIASSVSFGLSSNEGLTYPSLEVIPNGVVTESTIEEMKHPTEPLSPPINVTPSNTSSSSTVSQMNSTETIQTNERNSSSGKGLLLSRLPPHVSLYMIEFKSGRTDFYYVPDASLSLKQDDYVIVEADRGRDLGKVATEVLTADQVVLLDKRRSVHENVAKDHDSTYAKKIYRLATLDEIHTLIAKEQDEQKALQLCLQKIRHRKLNMEIVDAEFQWDRRKLTFYFIADKRIDFRELVRELFKIYKTRIWM